MTALGFSRIRLLRAIACFAPGLAVSAAALPRITHGSWPSFDSLFFMAGVVIAAGALVATAWNSSVENRAYTATTVRSRAFIRETAPPLLLGTLFLLVTGGTYALATGLDSPGQPTWSILIILLCWLVVATALGSLVGNLIPRKPLLTIPVAILVATGAYLSSTWHSSEPLAPAFYISWRSNPAWTSHVINPVLTFYGAIIAIVALISIRIRKEWIVPLACLLAAPFLTTQVFIPRPPSNAICTDDIDGSQLCGRAEEQRSIEQLNTGWPEFTQWMQSIGLPLGKIETEYLGHFPSAPGDQPLTVEAAASNAVTAGDLIRAKVTDSSCLIPVSHASVYAKWRFFATDAKHGNMGAARTFEQSLQNHAKAQDWISRATPDELASFDRQLARDLKTCTPRQAPWGT